MRKVLGANRKASRTNRGMANHLWVELLYSFKAEPKVRKNAPSEQDHQDYESFI